MNKRFFTAESVSAGHPDKIADGISDAVLDEILKQDKNARVACEVFVGMGYVVVGGEITTSAVIDVADIARKKVCEIGYNKPEIGFDGNNLAVLSSVNKQSSDIAQGVDEKQEGGVGAGDQGSVVGYACRETEILMPLPIATAHLLAKRLEDVRKKEVLPYLRPDGKAQVTFEYVDGKPESIENVVVSVQHDEDKSLEDIRQDVLEEVIKPVCKDYLSEKTSFYINNTGRFVVGGPVADTGLTGRKIVVDAYGPGVPVGGGAFSGKDPTKVDRSGAYMARYIAKNVVASGVAAKCQVTISYVIGGVNPTEVSVDTFGTAKKKEEDIVEAVTRLFDTTPSGCINQLGLLSPIYSQTSCYGHFGKENLPWEKTDKADKIREMVGF